MKHLWILLISVPRINATLSAPATAPRRNCSRWSPPPINLGPQPTFGGKERHPEAHLIGFTGSLSGQTLDLQFAKFLRPIQKFGSAETLAAQIQKDISAVIKSSH